MTTLRTRMLNDMIIRGYSPRTQESYIDAVAKLAKYHRRSPDTLSEQEVQSYLLYLIQERHYAWNSCHIVVHGLKFFYHITLGRPKAEFVIPVAKKPARLPEILSRAEVEKLLRLTTNFKHRMILTAGYAACYVSLYPRTFIPTYSSRNKERIPCYFRIRQIPEKAWDMGYSKMRKFY